MKRMLVSLMALAVMLIFAANANAGLLRHRCCKAKACAPAACAPVKACAPVAVAPKACAPVAVAPSACTPAAAPVACTSGTCRVKHTPVRTVLKDVKELLTPKCKCACCAK